MKYAALRSFEFYGLIAVVLSLVFVGYELNQANQIAKVTNNNESTGLAMSIQEMLLEDQSLLTLTYRAGGTETVEDFTGEELLRLYVFIQLLSNYWHQVETAYKAGQLPEYRYQTMFDDLRFIAKRGTVWEPTIRAYLKNYPSVEDRDAWRFVLAELDKLE